MNDSFLYGAECPTGRLSGMENIGARLTGVSVTRTVNVGVDGGCFLSNAMIAYYQKSVLNDAYNKVIWFDDISFKLFCTRECV